MPKDRRSQVGAERDHLTIILACPIAAVFLKIKPVETEQSASSSLPKSYPYLLLEQPKQMHIGTEILIKI